MGYIFKCSKNAFYGLTIHPFDMISKEIFGEMVLSVIARENRAGAKDRGRPFTFIFSQDKSYLK